MFEQTTITGNERNVSHTIKTDTSSNTKCYDHLTKTATSLHVVPPNSHEITIALHILANALRDTVIEPYLLQLHV